VSSADERDSDQAEGDGADVFLYLPQPLLDLVRRLAGQEDRTLAQVLRSALVAYSRTEGHDRGGR
jgi:hypothetical protein